ncbi:hypothetical protein BKA63DRAFT_16894 [Paraphoma chrysanthemicola]|nr:hypothetical protein BKA63DRAFT_16894 [Paraphoma chrysanthemicola]
MQSSHTASIKHRSIFPLLPIIQHPHYFFQLLYSTSLLSPVKLSNTMCPNHDVHIPGNNQPGTWPEPTHIRILEAEARLVGIEAKKLHLEKLLQRYRDFEAMMAERRAERDRVWQRLQELLQREASRRSSGADGFHDDEWRQSPPPSHLRGGGRGRRYSMDSSPPSFTDRIHSPYRLPPEYPACRAGFSTLDLSPPSSLIYPSLRPNSPHLHYAHRSPNHFRAPSHMTERHKAMLKRTIANIESEEQTLEAQKQSLRNILKEDAEWETTRAKKARKDIKGKQRAYVRDEKDEETEDIDSNADWAEDKHSDDEDLTRLFSDTDSDLGCDRYNSASKYGSCSRPPSRVHTWRHGYGPGSHRYPPSASHLASPRRPHSPDFGPALYGTSSVLDSSRHIHHRRRPFSPSFSSEFCSQARFSRPLSPSLPLPPRYSAPLHHYHDHHDIHHHDFSLAIQHERNALASSIARAETDILLAEMNKSDAEVDELRARVAGLRWSSNDV